MLSAYAAFHVTAVFMVGSVSADTVCFETAEQTLSRQQGPPIRQFFRAMFE